VTIDAPLSEIKQQHANVEARYPWAYGYLRSAVDGVLEMLTNDQYSADFSRRAAARDPQGLAIFQRLKTAVERIDEELGKNHDLRC